MFCANCGAKLADSSEKCVKCGHSINEDFITPNAGWIKGVVILFLSFFTMPFRTLKITVEELREIGSKNGLDIHSTDVPHLTWLIMASHIITSIIVVFIAIGGILKALMSLQSIQSSPEYALTEFFTYLLGGFLTATAADWGIMLTIEMLSLVVTMANGIKKVSEKN